MLCRDYILLMGFKHAWCIAIKIGLIIFNLRYMVGVRRVNI